MVITLYERTKPDGKCCFSALPEGVGNPKEKVTGKGLFLLPDEYDVREGMFGNGAIAIFKNGKLKSIHTDETKRLPYIIEYEANPVTDLSAVPKMNRIYLLRTEGEIDENGHFVRKVQ